MDNTVLVAALVLAGPLLLAALTNWQRRQERRADYERQDAVAAEAIRQQEEVATQAAETERRQTERSDEVAKQTAEVARLLLEAQKANTAGTDEVARLAAGGTGAERPEKCLRTQVVLSHPNGERQDVLLAGVPRTGDHIRVDDGRTSPPLVVEYVLWMEGERDPVVVVAVAPHDAQRRMLEKEG